jgi:hypothetical protein
VRSIGEGLRNALQMVRDMEMVKVEFTVSKGLHSSDQHRKWVEAVGPPHIHLARVLLGQPVPGERVTYLLLDSAQPTLLLEGEPEAVEVRCRVVQSDA